MRFIQTDNLKIGMRLAKPIYNKNGVLLFERNTKLTMQGIYSIKNFGLIGIYILEPAEPVPPMSKEDIEFERIQTMAVFIIKEDMNLISAGKPAKGITKLVNLLIKNYGQLDNKMNFMQNLRSNDDYIYKHSLNVAILAALMSKKMKFTYEEQYALIVAALYHDIGKLLLSIELRNKFDNLDENEMEIISDALIKGISKLENEKQIPVVARRFISQMHSKNKNQKISMGCKVLKVANMYDTMTAMKYNEEPSSEIATIRYLLENESEFDQEVVEALIECINILVPGVCIELTNGDKGLVIKENEKDILRPIILNFQDNSVYDLGYNATYNKVQIKDLMKTMDNRVIFDTKLVEEYNFKKI